MDAMYPLVSRLHRFAAGGDIRIVRASEFQPVPWNNGGGTTRDIDILTSGGPAEVVARLSLAAIERDGPFSDFRGYDRTIVPVAGAGFQLDFGGVDVVALATIGEPYGFDGGRAVSASLTAGPVSAFNVMTRRDRLRHQVSVGPHPMQFDVLPSVVRYLFVLIGRITIDDGSFAPRDAGESGGRRNVEVEAGDVLRVVGPGTIACRAAVAQTVVITVDLGGGC